MSSLLEEIVAIVGLSSPEASPEEVSAAVIMFLENDVLPEAFRKMRMPEPVSPARKWREEMMFRRMKKKYRKVARARREETEQLLLHFKNIKHKYSLLYMDGGSLVYDFFSRDIADSLRRRTISVNTVPAMNRFLLKRDGIPSIEAEEVRNKKEELSRLIPYTPVLKGEKKWPQIFLIDEIIQNKITSDPIFAENFGLIEKAARTFSVTSGFKMIFFASFRADTEIPEWEKIVLSVRLDGLDFNQKMELWDKLDAEIRKTIQERMKTTTGLEKERLEEMNRMLFTNFEL
jgi:hypothetical protein